MATLMALSRYRSRQRPRPGCDCVGSPLPSLEAAVQCIAASCFVCPFPSDCCMLRLLGNACACNVPERSHHATDSCAHTLPLPCLPSNAATAGQARLSRGGHGFNSHVIRRALPAIVETRNKGRAALARGARKRSLGGEVAAEMPRRGGKRVSLALAAGVAAAKARSLFPRLPLTIAPGSRSRCTWRQCSP